MNETERLRQICLQLLRVCENQHVTYGHGDFGDCLEYRPGLRDAAKRAVVGVEPTIDFEGEHQQKPAVRAAIRYIVNASGGM